MLSTINLLKSLREIFAIGVVLFFAGSVTGYSPLYAGQNYDGDGEARRYAEKNIITTVPDEASFEEDDFRWEDSNTDRNDGSAHNGLWTRDSIRIDNMRDAVACNRRSGGTNWSALSNAVLKFGLVGMGFYGMYTSYDIARRNISLKEGFLSQAMAKPHGNFRVGQGFFGGSNNSIGILGLGGLYGSLNGFFGGGGLNFGLGGRVGYGYGRGGSYPYNSGYPGNRRGCYYCRPIGPMGPMGGGGVYPRMMQTPPLQGRKP